MRLKLTTMNTHPLEQFLETFIPKLSAKSKQVNQCAWVLETTGSKDAAELGATLHTELRLLCSDTNVYQNLLAWDKDPTLTSPLLKRQLNVLLRTYKSNLIPKALLEEIGEKESILSYTYANFRPTLDGVALSENDIRKYLKEEENPSKRETIWKLSKEVGNILAPQILALVKLRNQAAKHLGYDNYYLMQLELQEVNSTMLFSLLDQLEKKSATSYASAIRFIEENQSKRFKVPKEKLGPWAWSDPFGQEDPLDARNFDSLLENVDLCQMTKDLYQKMGIDVSSILSASDMWERPGKNQHAFCINIDRGQDVRTLNNLKSTAKWLETILHELGHAIYELGFNPSLPWLLREPPHMIPTEAMALLAGRKAYLSEVLSSVTQDSKLLQEIQEGAKRRQLIFSRFVLVMTYFEKSLYENPEQDLNGLWWDLVQKHQKITPPTNREGKNDWAAKYHIGAAPAYYYSYLLGELFASEIEEQLLQTTGSRDLFQTKAGTFLQEKLFAPGNSLSWSDLAVAVTGHPFSAQPWVNQFACEDVF